MLKFFRLPFATTGDKTAVPDDVDTNGNVSYSQGYGFDYQRQKTDPAAKNIERDKMNQILFDVTNAVAELQAQGVPDFITSALNGGAAYSYEQFAVVRYSGDLYISLVTANTADPTDATKWALMPTPARIQAAFNTSAVAAGTADALTAAFAPAIAALPAAPGTLSVLVRAGGANTTTTPTFSPDGLTAKTIVKGNNLPLVAGDIAGAGHWLDLQYDAALDKWVLQNPAFGVSQGQGLRLLNIVRLRTVGSGTYNKPSNVNALLIKAVGAGGSSGTAALGAGAGGYCERLITAPASSYAYTIGAAGSGAPSAGGATTIAGMSAGGGTPTAGAGGVATGGDLNVNGGSGAYETTTGGWGGASVFGGGGYAGTANWIGSGGSHNGAGGNGYIEIWEFA